VGQESTANNMSDASTRRYEARTRIIRAMASPTRLMLVAELTQNDERCVCELAALVEADISTVSRHLLILRQAGIIDEERRGKMTYYHIRNPVVQRFFDFAECCLRQASAEQEEMAV
jgi:DNA-binding transcriptional ArsR family regulator